MSRSTHALLSVITVAAAGALALPGSAALAMPAPDPEGGHLTATGPASAAPTPLPTESRGSDEGVLDGRGEWPLQPRPAVASYFQPPEVRWGSGHRGIDLVGRTGQPVRSSMAGRVSFAGRIAGVPIVVVDHGGTRTTYQPVDASVARGTQVTAGEVLGTLVWTGTHCSPAACLHWGWRRGDTYLDPLLLVGAAPRPVRLLPL